MVIGLEATHLSIYGKGVSRYQYNLIKNLVKLDKNNQHYVFLNKKNTLPELPRQDNFHYIKIYIPNRIIWDQILLPMLMKKYRLDVYQSCLDTLPIFAKGKIVLYLFEIPDYRIDLAYRLRKTSLYAKISYKYTRLFFRRSLKKAKVIMVSSHSTKADLIHRYDIDGEKIRVVYPAADEQFYASYSAKEGYILHFSSSDPRDNTEALIYAYHKAKRQFQFPQKLVIGGNVYYKKNGLDKLTKNLNLEGSIVFAGYHSGEGLTRLYQSADLFVDPSFYEGFGFQVIEALACGLPVITSNVTSLPEIVGDAGILLDPNDIDGLADAMVRILNDSGLRNNLRQKAQERAKFFSWKKMAQETLGIYNEVFA